MTVLIAFDCDGTLDASNGHILVSRLGEINIPPYIQIVIVSPSSYCSQLPFPRFVNGSTRIENLLEAAIAYPSLLNIYVSDNQGDDVNARNAGFVYVHPNDFNLPIK